MSCPKRQRLALARALLRRPALLPLDEATSNLDRDNEGRIQEAVRRLPGELAIVVITHRLSTIQDAAQLVVLERGRVKSVGTWKELGPALSRRGRRGKEGPESLSVKKGD